MRRSRSKPISIAVAVVRHEGQVLIGQRPAGVELAGFWEFPGGKVQADETLEQAAMRECLEETELAIRILRTETDVTHHYDFGLVKIRFFAAEPANPEHVPRAPFRWVPISDLPNYPFPPANAVVLEYLAEGDRR